MLRHPFHGIVAADDAPVSLGAFPANDGCPSRRTFFRSVLAALAGGAAILFSRASDAAQPRSRYPGSPRGRFTTQAIGEEGGIVTTQAVGEEGGVFPPPRPPRPLPPPGAVTTQALGEEGGIPPGRYTTYALGEEGAGRWRR
jgi:hypothetical protein